MEFQNRSEAAQLLADQLKSVIPEKPLVLGIPRGSVPMAKILADRLEGDFDVVLVHKVGAPDNPEYAIASVSEFGDLYPMEGARLHGFSEAELRKLAQTEIQTLQQRRRAYTPVHPAIDPRGRTVIIVDDGLATGATMLAAIRALRARHARTVIVATPVASPGAMQLLKPEADQIVALEVPSDFFSVGQFYQDFQAVTDSEVIRTLSEPHPHKAAC
jgi:putative phosphoribosyl transferase